MTSSREVFPGRSPTFLALQVVALLAAPLLLTRVTLGGIASTSGDIAVIPVPPSAIFDELEADDKIWMFTERQGYVIPQDVTVDITAAGYYDHDFSSTGTVLPAGTAVNCYFLHFDALDVPGHHVAETAGSVTFHEEILGIICSEGALDASDQIFGVTLYSTGQNYRGYEENSQEQVELSADRHSFIIHRFITSFPGEDTRIITTPEPATLGLVGFGGLGLLARRRKKFRGQDT